MRLTTRLGAGACPLSSARLSGGLPDCLSVWPSVCLAGTSYVLFGVMSVTEERTNQRRSDLAATYARDGGSGVAVASRGVSGASTADADPVGTAPLAKPAAEMNTAQLHRLNV